MMNRPPLLVVILMVLSACEMGRVDAPTKPKNLMPEEQMIEVLYDMAILNSAKNINKKVLENKGIAPVYFIYDKYGIDSLQFAESSVYYTYKREMIQRIYDSVFARLERDKIYYEAAYSEETAKADSLSKATLKYRDSIKGLGERELNAKPFKIPSGEMRNKRRLNPEEKDSLGLGY